MNRFLKAISLSLAAALLMTACKGNGTSQTDTTAPQTTASSAPDGSQEPDSTSAVMPVLSIETVNQADDVMTFVTEPVAPHVSEQIATWTPNYVMPPAPYYEACTVKLTDTDGKELVSAGAQVKARGTWTTT